jgi:hypothetical protein
MLINLLTKLVIGLENRVSVEQLISIHQSLISAAIAAWPAAA